MVSVVVGRSGKVVKPVGIEIKYKNLLDIAEKWTNAKIEYHREDNTVIIKRGKDTHMIYRISSIDKPSDNVIQIRSPTSIINIQSNGEIDHYSNM